MEFIIIAGPQAVGKMTVGLELEKLIDARLLFNHQTIDLFANFLNYTSKTFELSEMVRNQLFTAFVENEETNATSGLILSVVVAYDSEKDWEILNGWVSMFIEADADVYYIELEADLNERLKRNVHKNRLAAKPSKRDIDFSKHELLTSNERHRLNSEENEVLEYLPKVNYLRINNTNLDAENVAKQIFEWMKSSANE